MGTRVPKSIADFGRFDLDLGVRCLRCRRMAVFDPKDVMVFFIARSIPTILPIASSPFRCRCGSRDLETTGVAKCCRPDPLPPKPPALHPLYVQEHRR